MGKELKENFEKAANAYLKAFCEKQGFDYENAKESWAANDVGSVVCCGDFFFAFEDIRTDIDNNAPVGEIIKWYDYHTEMAYLNLPLMNYRSWLNGAPRVSQETIDRVKGLMGDLDSLREEAKDIYKEF